MLAGEENRIAAELRLFKKKRIRLLLTPIITIASLNFNSVSSNFYLRAAVSGLLKTEVVVVL